VEFTIASGIRKLDAVLSRDMLLRKTLVNEFVAF
jgi:hypothetical protein